MDQAGVDRGDLGQRVFRLADAVGVGLGPSSLFFSMFLSFWRAISSFQLLTF